MALGDTGLLADIPSGLRKFLSREHNIDGSHKGVTADTLELQDGSVGVVSRLNYDAARFSSSAGTWTVSSTQMSMLHYSRVGQMCFVQFFCDGSALATAVAASLFIALPELHALPFNGPTLTTGLEHTGGTLRWNDRAGATTGLGWCTVQPTVLASAVPRTRLVMYAGNGATFPISADLVVACSCWFPLEVNNQPHPFYGV